MSLKEIFKIEKIENKLAQKVVIENHYLHRKAPCSHAFGLFDNNDNLMGVIIYGIPASRAAVIGIAGEENCKNVIELTRLWVDDQCPKNSESFLIGNTIKLIPHEIIISYADTKMNHLGIVYQATNWIYVGLTVKRKDYKIIGKENNHPRTMFRNNLTVKDFKEQLGDNLYLEERSRKHRYVYINTKSKKRKQELLNQLRYEILPYPKNHEQT
jgi:hypothetical protein